MTDRLREALERLHDVAVDVTAMTGHDEACGTDDCYVLEALAAAPEPGAAGEGLLGGDWTVATLRRSTHKYLHGEDYEDADRCDDAPCTWLRAALSTTGTPKEGSGD